MLRESREKLLLEWDEQLLLGGVMLSEWSVFLIQDADKAFCSGADLAALLTAQAAMEAHLRHEQQPAGALSFVQLIERSDFSEDTKRRLHEVRRFRNRWVHVRDPSDDGPLLEKPDDHRAELAEMATRAMRLLREVIYAYQWL